MTADRLAAATVNKIVTVNEAAVDSSAGRKLIVTALRLLAAGHPITVDELAATAGVAAPDLAAAPVGGDIEYDDQGRIVGWGLTLKPTPHRFTVNGHQLYTYCAPDTLIFPVLIDEVADVESEDPVTGTTVRLTVDPRQGVSGVEPAGAVVTFVDPERFDATRVRATLCDPQRFFADAGAARQWQARYPGMRIVPVPEGFSIAKDFAALLETGATPVSGCC
ncbi:organomercurial lyase MerB [Amycolatopsis echigonensis]|uniref:Alkylmercury lyase n=1 Tax=Amycolatopsis echigonensis TaxID=2576905 RepID=A0A8E1W4T6_9PSEU|nr:organomercurial lyase MerB [Amycolatopsis echigonensis]MBB2504026.1 organomercurial lyase MerB [Amycolatopsis echigonensis]